MIIDFVPNPGSSSFMDFPSGITVKTTITSTGADKTLSDIPVTLLPVGSRLTRATLLLLGRGIENDNASTNKLNIDDNQHIQLSISGGTLTNAIKLEDEMSDVAANSRDGSFVWFGNIDLTSVVTGNATYNVQWTDAESEVNSLIVHTIQTILRIYYIL